MLNDDDPHGTVEELTRVRANLLQIGSCSRKRRDEENRVVIIGCKVRKFCDLPEKEGKGPKTSGYNGQGPCRVGCLAVKVLPTGRKVVTRVVLDCFHLPGFRKRIEQRGFTDPETGKTEYGSVTVTHREGETIELQGSTFEDKLVPGQGNVRVYTDGPIPTKIEKFPRPGQKGNLANMEIAARELERARGIAAKSTLPKLLGVEDEDDAQTQAP